MLRRMGKKNLNENMVSCLPHSDHPSQYNYLELQGGDRLFGEPSFDVNDLMVTNNRGQGMINILRLNCYSG
jgi:hypothetical protein